MKYGYACQNISNHLTTNRSIRLSLFTEATFYRTVRSNISHLGCILGWNHMMGILHFRIGPRIIPYASHPVCCYDWQYRFRDELRELGCLIKQRQMRISMHADQSVVINSPESVVVQRSIDELAYMNCLLDLLGLGTDAKIQIHAGGIYQNLHASKRRFAKNYGNLPDAIRSRLVVENDRRLIGVRDCLELHELTGIPVVFDKLNHECLNHGEYVSAAMLECLATWKPGQDGPPIVEYNEQAPDAAPGTHARHLDAEKFMGFYTPTRNNAFDLMLEFGDREYSALKLKSLLSLEDRYRVARIGNSGSAKI